MEVPKVRKQKRKAEEEVAVTETKRKKKKQGEKDLEADLNPSGRNVKRSENEEEVMEAQSEPVVDQKKKKKEKMAAEQATESVQKKKRRKKNVEQDIEAKLPIEEVGQSISEQEKQVEVPKGKKCRKHDNEQEEHAEQEISKEEKPRKAKKGRGKTVPDQTEEPSCSTKCMKRKNRLQLEDTEVEVQSSKRAVEVDHTDHVRRKKKKKQEHVEETSTKEKDEGLVEDEKPADLWNKLPLEMKQKILANLPVEQLLTLRTVSRGLRNVISSSELSDVWRKSQRTEESTVLIRYRYPSRKSSRCYSSGIGKWCNVPNSFFLPKDGFLLKDAKNGLVAARLEKQIGVGNPVTREWVYLDPTQVPDWQKCPWTLLVPRRKAGNGFDFRLLVGDRFYDSRTLKWEQVNLPGDTAYGSVYCDGVSAFYYLCEDDGLVKLVRGSMDNPRNFEVLRSWNPPEFDYPLYHQLLDYHGELGLISDKSPWVRGLSFHVFDEVSRNWVLKSFLPKEMALRVLMTQGRKKKWREGASLTEKEIWQFATCGAGTLSFVVPRGCRGFILFDTRDMSWRWISDPARVVGMRRRSDVYCTELSL